MAYTDSLQQVSSADNAANGAATSSPTTFANGVNLLNVGESPFVVPAGCEIIDFVVSPYSAAATAYSTAPVYALHTGSAVGGTSAEVCSVTLAASTAQGARVRSSSASLPKKVPAGGFFKVVKKTAANAGTENVRAYVVFRQLGTVVGGNTSSVLTSVAS